MSGCGCEGRAAAISTALRGLADRMDAHRGRTLAGMLAVAVLAAGTVALAGYVLGGTLAARGSQDAG